MDLGKLNIQYTLKITDVHFIFGRPPLCGDLISDPKCESLSPVNCLECYSCTSTDSWDDCNSKQKKIECSWSSECLKGTLSCSAGNEEKTVYYKRCAAGDSCETTKGDSPGCPNTGVIWSFSSLKTCCSGGLCNAATRTAARMLSGLVFTCTAMGMFAVAVMFQ